MTLQEAQESARWAAPKAWPDEKVARATRLLFDGRSVRRVARALQLEPNGVARVQRVLRAAGVKVRFPSCYLPMIGGRHTERADLPGPLPMHRPAVAAE